MKLRTKITVIIFFAFLASGIIFLLATKKRKPGLPASDIASFSPSNNNLYAINQSLRAAEDENSQSKQKAPILKPKATVSVAPQSTKINNQTVDNNSCSIECSQELRSIAATISSQYLAQALSQIQHLHTVYIPIGGSGQTSERKWQSIDNASIYLNRADYPDQASIRWEAFIKLKHQNGKAYARLWDNNHQIAVADSVLTTTSGNFSLVTSQPLNLFSGNNLYVVQIKSLTGYEVTIDSPRFKINI